MECTIEIMPQRKVTIPQREALEIQCHRCKKIWVYTGKNPYYAQCSNCRTTVKIIHEDKL